MTAHPDSVSQYAKNEKVARDVLGKFGTLTRRRPRRLYELILRLLLPGEVRRIVRLETGLTYYVNPLNQIGRDILERGGYEVENEQLFRRHVKPGDVVLDVGANEGYFTALFGVLTGSAGRVIAIEPQTRLGDFIQINCLLNGVTHLNIFQKALGAADAEDGYLALYSMLNTGMSSLVKRYHSTTGYEKIPFISIEQIMAQADVDHIDFVKIDTEGFEVEIINSMLPIIRRGLIGKLVVDYHEAILRARGISSERLDKSLLEARMTRTQDAPNTQGGYVIYQKTEH